MHSTLQAMATQPRMTGAQLAARLWPGKDPEPRKSIAEGRLRKVAKAGLAHVAFEPLWPNVTYLHETRRQHPVYEISAFGRTAIGWRWACAR